MAEDYYISSYVNSARVAVKSVVYDYETTLYDRLARLVSIYYDLYLNEAWIAYVLVSNYHSKYLGKSQDEIIQANLGINDIRETVAAEYGYRDWSIVETLNEDLDPLFESTVDAITFGNIEQIRKNLRIKPSLCRQCSQFGHRASLLHYIAANGVELYRQSLGYNAVELANLLVENGADKQAKMIVYGGEFTAIDLLLSSAHPQEAGLVDGLSEILTH